MPALVEAQVFTDPGCPFAYSAEPARWRLRWLFGDQLAWRSVMVVIVEDGSELAARGFTPELSARHLADLAERYGMPIDSRPQTRIANTIDACRAVIATRIHRPESEDRMLRALRRAAMGGQLIDDHNVIAHCAERSGIDGRAIREWLPSPVVGQGLRHDMELARAPAVAALALNHKLAPAPSGQRYTCPSYELSTTKQVAPAFVAPGFQPQEVYEVLLANLDPKLTRRATPRTVEEVLTWAGEPLATAEVAAVMDLPLLETRRRLQRQAEPDPVANDAFWTMTPAP